MPYSMAAFIALSLLAAQATAWPAATTPASGFPTRAAVAAEASVRILAGAKVSLSSAPQPDGQDQRSALVTLEDGRSYPAKLVEFQ